MAECRFTELTPARSLSQLSEEERLSAEIEAYEDGGFAVRSVFVSDISYASESAEGGKIEGTLCFNVLIADGENRLSLLSRNVGFMHPVPDGSCCVACEVSTGNPSAKAVSGGKIAVSCVLSLRMLTRSGDRVRMLTDVKESEEAAAPGPERAVVYFAEKGESLWNIAKENRTSVDNIKAFNSLSSDVIESDVRLIFSGF